MRPQPGQLPLDHPKTANWQKRSHRLATSALRRISVVQLTFATSRKPPVRFRLPNCTSSTSALALKPNRVDIPTSVTMLQCNMEKA